MLFLSICLPVVALVAEVNAAPPPRAVASSFAGSTSTFEFPPSNVTITSNSAFFPSAGEVGFAGPTPTGDEADAIATAPAVAKVKNVFPLVRPNTADRKHKNFNIFEQWGSLSLFRSVKSFGLDDATALVPDSCKLKQVHLLHRHGARYPSGLGDDSNIGKFNTKLHAAASGSGFRASGPLKFLSTWTYKLGTDILTPFGQDELFNLSVGFRVKYVTQRFYKFSGLVNNVSILHFAAGFFGVQEYNKDYHQLIEIEAFGFNSTLIPLYTCPKFGPVGQAKEWTKKYLAKAQKRISRYIHGVNITVNDMAAMQELCVYETVALGYSAFCDLFTEKEWQGFSYANDLDFWYLFGPGNPAVNAQGRGWVEELVSRLTKKRITTFESSVNSTIVSSNITFPLDQLIFVDATHDATIVAVLSAMNFTSLAANGPLPTDHIPKNQLQTWFTRQIVPFASNLVGQVLSCPASESEEPTHIRWILNDGILPLTGVRGCSEDPDGLCELSTFISGMQQRIEEIDFQSICFGNSTASSPVPPLQVQLQTVF